MNQYEALQALKDSLLERWDGWNPTERDRNDWTRLFSNYTREDVEQAAQNYRRRYEIYTNKGPSMPKFAACLSDVAQPIARTAAEHGRPRYYVQCVEGGANCKDGTFFAYMGGIDIHSLTEEAEKCQKSYGGRWNPIIADDPDTTFKELCDYRREKSFERKTKEGRKNIKSLDKHEEMW